MATEGNRDREIRSWQTGKAKERIKENVFSIDISGEALSSKCSISEQSTMLVPLSSYLQTKAVWQVVKSYPGQSFAAQT